MAHKDGKESLIIDTRAHPRYATTMMVRATGQNTMFESRGNISLGGFFFGSKVSMPVDLQVEILFRLPGAGLWMKAYGQVIQSEITDGGWAVRGVFKEFDPADIKAINTWMQFITLSKDNNESQVPFLAQDPTETTLFSTEFSS